MSSGTEYSEVQESIKETPEVAEARQTVDRAAFAPEAAVEKTSDFKEAEAVQEAFVAVMPAVQLSETPSAPETGQDSGGKSGLGSQNTNPADHYAGVNMTQGEVLKDNDWNEDGSDPNTVETYTPSLNENQATAAEHIEGQSEADVGAIAGLRMANSAVETLEAIIDELQEEPGRRQNDNTSDQVDVPEGMTDRDLPAAGQEDAAEMENYFESERTALEAKAQAMGSETGDIRESIGQEQNEYAIGTSSESIQDRSVAVVQDIETLSENDAGAAQDPNLAGGEPSAAGLPTDDGVSPPGQEQQPTAATGVQKVDDFSAKLGVAKDEVGEFRTPSLHASQITPLEEPTAADQNQAVWGDGPAPPGSLSRTDEDPPKTRLDETLTLIQPADSEDDSSDPDPDKLSQLKDQLDSLTNHQEAQRDSISKLREQMEEVRQETIETSPPSSNREFSLEESVQVAAAATIDFTGLSEYATGESGDNTQDSSGGATSSNIQVEAGLRVQLEQSRQKTATGKSFSDIAASGLNKAADVAMSAGQLAAPYIPGGSVLNAAMGGSGGDAGEVPTDSSDGSSDLPRKPSRGDFPDTDEGDAAYNAAVESYEDMLAAAQAQEAAQDTPDADGTDRPSATLPVGTILVGSSESNVVDISGSVSGTAQDSSAESSDLPQPPNINDYMTTKTDADGIVEVDSDGNPIFVIDLDAYNAACDEWMAAQEELNGDGEISDPSTDEPQESNYQYLESFTTEELENWKQDLTIARSFLASSLASLIATQDYQQDDPNFVDSQPTTGRINYNYAHITTDSELRVDIFAGEVMFHQEGCTYAISQVTNSMAEVSAAINAVNAALNS